MKAIKLFVLLSLIGLATVTNAQDAKTILKEVDNVLFAPKDYKGKMKIVITNKNGKETVREAIGLQKGMDKNLFRFTPAFGKERRISSSVKNQKFAGTDFSYDDMEAKQYSEKYTDFSYDDMEAKQYSEKYSPKLLKTDADVFVLELIPFSKKSDYSKLIAKVNKTNYCPIEIKYYDKRGQESKLAIFKFEKIGKYWNNKEIVMHDLKAKSNTKIIKYDIKFDVGLSDDEFTVRKLKQ